MPKIIIMGCGIGGLTVAHELVASIDSNYEIHLYERHDIIGGIIFFILGSIIYNLGLGLLYAPSTSASLSAANDIRGLAATSPQGEIKVIG